jgi:hypothetical protein
MDKPSNPLQACLDIVLTPNRVFAKLAKTDNWSWIPFLLVVISSVLPIYFYFKGIDFDWYRDLIIQSTAGDISPAEQKMMRDNMQPATIEWASLIGAVFSMIIGNVILAFYLHVVGKSDSECVQGFTDWYGFTWWVNLPVILASAFSLLRVLAMNDPQLAPISLNTMSVAFLFSVDMKSIWFGLSQAIRLDSFWTIYLIAVGLSQWTQLAKNRCYVFAMAPYAVIWGIWFVYLLFK